MEEAELVLKEAVEISAVLLAPTKKLSVDFPWCTNDFLADLLGRCVDPWYQNIVTEEVSSDRPLPVSQELESLHRWHPIHLAVLTENHEMINLIVSKDKRALSAQFHYNLETITPLMSAAAKGSISTMRLLFDHGATFCVNPIKNMEWAIRGKNVECLFFVVGKAKFDPTLEKLGKIDIFNLFALGALGDDAAQMLKVLLNFEESTMKRVSIVTFKRTIVENTVNVDRQRLFFLALEKGYKEVLKVLLKEKVSPNDCSPEGIPAMHHTIRHNTKGICSTDNDIANELLDILLNNGALINQRDPEGRTALNLAAKAGLAKCALVLILREAEISVSDMRNLNERVPNFLKNHLDSLISSKGMTSSPSGELASIDIRFMGAKNSKKWKERKFVSNKEDYRELNFLKFVIDDGQEHLLMHPVIQTYLHTKWLFFRKFFYMSAILYVCQLVSLTIFITKRFEVDDSNCTSVCPRQDTSSLKTEDSGDDAILVIAVVGTCSLLWSRSAAMINAMVLGIFKAQMIQHIFEIILIVLILFTLFPSTNNQTWTCCQRVTAAIAILVAWCNSLFLLARHPNLGIYVEMLGKVFKNFATFFMTYTCFLIGYALSFRVLSPGNPAFKTYLSSIMEILTWMIGELPTRNENESTEVTYILNISFILTVTVALINLLIGLAVHDINGLLQRAKLNKSIRQVRYMHIIESMFYSKLVTNFCPTSMKKYLRRSTKLPFSVQIVTIFPNKSGDRRLPYALKQEALAIAKKNIQQSNDNNYVMF